MNISDSQMREIVRDYHRMLPAWRHVSTETLARVDGPVLQFIGFQCLRTGDYRPMNGIRVLVAPEPERRGGPDFFAQMPESRPRTLSLQLHKKMQNLMFENMKREFVPEISEPLDGKAMLDMCERDAVPKSPQAYALAGLNAYFGNFDRARYWCSRFPELVNELGREWQSWHYQQKAFLDSLEEWMKTGETKARLEGIVVQERAKWNFT